MVSYFFIPANKFSNLPLITQLGVDNIIIDFEDSLVSNQREEMLRQVADYPERNAFFYRIPLRNAVEDAIDFNYLDKFLELGIRKILIPKLINLKEAESLFDHLKDHGVSLILLIEHPRLLSDLRDILLMNEPVGLLKGIALGTHDLSVTMGFEHQELYFNYPRNIVLFQAKAFGIEAIDFASMDVHDYDRFTREVQSGLEMGFDAKFLIHPRQFEWLTGNDLHRKKQLARAEKIINSLPEGNKTREINPFILDGQIIEKAHIENALKTIKKYKDGI